MRCSLSELHEKIDISSGAVTSIGSFVESRDDAAADVVRAWNDTQTLLSALRTEITNAYDKIDAVMMLLSEGDVLSMTEIMRQMEDISVTMQWISTNYEQVNTDITTLTEALRERENTDLSMLAAYLETLDHERTTEVPDLNLLAAQIAENIDLYALQQGVDTANAKLDLLLTRMERLEALQSASVPREAVQNTQEAGPVSLPEGDAGSAHVLSGRTYLTAEGTLSAGTMPDHSAIGPVVWIPAGQTTYTFAEGYYGAFTVEVDAVTGTAGTLEVAHHVHSTASVSETVMSNDMAPTADGPADDYVSPVQGGCFTLETGHRHDASCYRTESVRVPVNVCRGTMVWSGPYGPDASGKQYWSGSCSTCGVGLGGSYTGPGSSSLPEHTAGSTSVQYRTENKSVIGCGRTEDAGYLCSCGKSRGEVVSYTVKLD